MMMLYLNYQGGGFYSLKDRPSPYTIYSFLVKTSDEYLHVGLIGETREDALRCIYPYVYRPQLFSYVPGVYGDIRLILTIE